MLNFCVRKVNRWDHRIIEAGMEMINSETKSEVNKVIKMNSENRISINKVKYERSVDEQI